MFKARFGKDWREGSHKDGQESDCKIGYRSHVSSITYELEAKAVRYYTKGFSEEDKMRVEAGLDMLKFSMFNCLINFGPDYFQYGKDKDPLKKVLPIGGFGTAWLADLIACYILEKTGQVWLNEFAYFKIYRDGGCALARNKTVRRLNSQWKS